MNTDDVLHLDFLELGLSDFCQNRCIMCHQSREWFASISRRFLDTELALRLFSELEQQPVQINSLYLFWIGEPLLHPDFAKILRRAFPQHGGAINGFTLNSNGNQLETEPRQAIYDAAENAQFAQVILSLDSLNSETYGRIRKGGNHQVTLQHFEEFLSERQCHNLTIIPQMIVMPENMHEISSFIEGIQKIGARYGVDFPVTGSRSDFSQDVIYLRPLLFDESWQGDSRATERWHEANNAWKNALKDFSNTEDPDDTRRKEAADPRQSQEGVCASVFQGVIVTTEGLLVPCCGDYAGELSCGDLNSQTFTQAFFSREFTNLRNQLLSGSRENLPSRCRRCYLPGETRISQAEAESIHSSMIYWKQQNNGREIT